MTKSITDTGPPVHLSEISRLSLIKILHTLTISTQVKKELEDFNAWHSLQQVESLSLKLEKVSNREIAQERNRWMDYKLQQANLSLLVLSRCIEEALILTDDLELRKAIESTGRVVVGSVGVLIRGY